MLAAVGRACLAPFRHRGPALVSFLLVSGLPLALLIGVDLMEQLAFSGAVFFDPEGGTDPLLLQNALWIGGHPETIQIVSGLCLLLFGPWAFALWWQALEGERRRVTFDQIGRVAIWFWLALTVLLLNGLYFAIVRDPIPLLDGAVLVVLGCAVVAALVRLRPRFAIIFGEADGCVPGWGRCVAVAGLVLLIGLIAQTLGLLAWTGVVSLGRAELGAPGSETPRWIVALLLLEWQGIFAVIASGYTMLVATALVRDPGDAHVSETVTR